MLSAVGLGQSRLTLPGLVPDGRGVVAGRELAARFPTLDRMVWYLRLLSGERGPDDLWLGMRIVYARSAMGLREVIVLMGNPSSHAADLCARAARSAGGQCFTGSGKHFVQYRDGRAPFGYDAREISHEPGDVTLYATDSTVSYKIEGEMSFERLLFGLELRRRSGPIEASLPTGDNAVVYVTARRGLGRRLLDHLFHAEISAQGALCEPERPSVFGVTSAFWLFRIENLPPRLASLIAHTPGLEAFTPVLDNVAVAAGHTHPVHLEACRALFSGDRFVLFSPPPTGVTVMPAPLPLVPVADLVSLRPPPIADGPPAVVAPSGPSPFEVPLRLEAVGGTRGHRAVAAWIPWSQAAWLRRLCYARPPAALRGHRVAFLEPALLVLAERDLSGLPLGQPLDHVGPGILAPVGMRIAPAIAPERLAERLGVTEGTYLVFPSASANPYRVSADQLQPLERHILAQARVEQERPPLVPRPSTPAEDAGPPDVVHDPLGPWPLWGLRR
jgi:hypothetical protein